jgi:hypothetical protein
VQHQKSVSLFSRTADFFKTNRDVVIVFIIMVVSFIAGLSSLALVDIAPSTSFGESVENVAPPAYWASIAVIIVGLVYMLQSERREKFKLPFLLSCIMLVFLMRSVLAILSPYPAVPDTWGGIYITESWKKYGLLSPVGLAFFSGGYVRGWPTSYILSYLITSAGIPVFTFYRWAPSAIFTLDLIVIYFLFKELVNPKIGMISALLFALLNTNSFFPLHYSAQTLGALFYLVTMYAIVKAYKTRKLRHLAFVFVGIFAVVLTHHMTTFYLGVTLAGAYLGRYFLKLQQELSKKGLHFSLPAKPDTFVKLSLSLSVFVFALWYFYGFIVYRIDAVWMLTEIARLLTTHQPRYSAGYYYYYLIQSPLSKLAVIVFPAFILISAAIYLLNKVRRRQPLDGYLWLILGWAGALILAFIFGNAIYGNYIDPSRSREIITVALYPASALLLLGIFESKSSYKKVAITAVLIMVAFLSVLSIYRGAQNIVYFEPPWWMQLFNSP